MIKLIDILKELEGKDPIDPSPVKIDSSDFEDLAQGIEAALQDAAEEQNESVVAATLFVFAVPAILNAVAKFAEGFVQKAEKAAKKIGINLKKSSEDPAWYKILGNVTDKIDGYLDTPFRIILTPFITDQVKRDKTAKFLKAIALASAAIMGAVDVTKIPTTFTAIKNLAGPLSGQILEAIAQNNAGTFGATARKALGAIIKTFMTGL